VKLQTRTVDYLAQQRLLEGGLTPLLARLLAARGISHHEDARLELAGMLPPESLMGLEAGARLLDETIERNEPILIVGDYDCDGATAIAVAVLGLRMMGAAHVDYLVPNRFDNGYGLTPEVAEMAARHPRLGCPRLLVTVDNGIASVSGVERAHELGMKVLVTDHHLPGDHLPNAEVIVNPNQPGCGFPSKCIAGVGVMFYLLTALRALRREAGRFAGAQPSLAPLLDLVALGTVADVVPLDRNNRILVAAGLQRIRAGRCRPGISALLQVARRTARTIAAADLGFAVGPRLNAAGRLADMSLGVECLLAEDFARAMALAEELDQINHERRAIEQTMRDQATSLLCEVSPERLALVVHDAGWHHGVIGLVASRMKDLHHRPCIAMAPENEEILRGSGRSIPGVHLRDVLDLVEKRNPGMLIKFGGHAMAAGLSMRRVHLEAFTAAFEAAVASLADTEAFSPSLLTDGPLDGPELCLDVIEQIDSQIWGQGFAQPLFSGRFTILSQRLIKDRHMKLELALESEPRRRLKAIFFGRSEALPQQAVLAYRLQREEYQGLAGVCLHVEHVLSELTAAAR
jgi:single-stranded-DNA-specific exonuclease